MKTHPKKGVRVHDRVEHALRLADNITETCDDGGSCNAGRVLRRELMDLREKLEAATRRP